MPTNPLRYAPMRYAIAIGSNRAGRHGRPIDEVRAAIVALAALGDVVAASPIIETPPLGPSTRRFANAAAIIATDLPPPALLARLKVIERDFGRRPGRRWGTRVIDLDIILWGGGAWAGRTRDGRLTIPHIGFRDRAFVLAPLIAVAPGWRDPVTRLTIRHLAWRHRPGIRA